jgi:undecaprenyl-phosphate 4-deoxy-4-formamido-L-arabinose transferase
VYRSALILPKLVEQVKSAMDSIAFVKSFELILVNDSSPDNSWSVITALSAENPFIKGVALRKNFGQHNAIMAGLHYSNGQFVVLMDDDLQHPPEAIQKLLEALVDGYDVCYTNYVGRKHAAWKRIGSAFNDFVATRILNKPKGLYLSSFKAMRREIVREIIRYDGPYAYVDGLILDITRSITSVDIQHQAREIGNGNYNLRRSVSLWLKMATSFSVLPLRLATAIGFALALVSLVIIIFIAIEKILHPDYPRGWASLIASILFIGGIQTLCIGMIGEYLGRAYLKLNNKPQFVVARTTFSREDGDE